MIRKFAGLAAAGALTAGLLSACGEAAPPLTKPNGSVEQVLNNLDYKGVLGGKAVRQVVHVGFNDLLGKPDTVTVWNYTHSRLKPGEYGRIVRLLGQTIATEPGSLHFPIDYSRRQPNLRVSVQTSENVDDTHDVLLVPEGEDAPPLEDFSVDQDTTRDLADSNILQTISLVYQPTGEFGGPEKFLPGDGGLETETCQALVSTLANYTNLPANINTTTVDTDAQETVCNTFGTAIQDSLLGYSYTDYRQFERTDTGTVTDNGVTYEIKDFTVPRTLYATIHNALTG